MYDDIISPSGMVYKLKLEARPVKVMACPNVVEVAERFKAVRTKAIPMELVGDIIRVAKCHLGSNPCKRLSYLYESAPVSTGSDHLFEFIADTVKYITCGTRPVSIRSRRQLIDFLSPGDIVHTASLINRQTRPKLDMELDQHGYPSETSEYVAWIRRQDGIYDLVNTLVVLFGTPHQLCCNK